jgi:hypothetical protein
MLGAVVRQFDTTDAMLPQLPALTASSSVPSMTMRAIRRGDTLSPAMMTVSRVQHPVTVAATCARVRPPKAGLTCLL